MYSEVCTCIQEEKRVITRFNSFSRYNRYMTPKPEDQLSARSRGGTPPDTAYRAATSAERPRAPARGGELSAISMVSDRPAHNLGGCTRSIPDFPRNLGKSWKSMIFHQISMKIYEKSWIFMISQSFLGNLGWIWCTPQVMCEPMAKGK